MTPHAAQTRVEVLVLRKAHLEATLFGGRMQREDIEDERRAVDNLDRLADDFLEVRLLAGAELVIEDDEVGLHTAHKRRKLLRLARADERARVGRLEALRHRAHDIRTRRVDEALELRQGLLERPVDIAAINTDEHSALREDFRGGDLELLISH